MCVIVGGKVGCNMGWELGRMGVREEIDGVDMMGVKCGC